LLLGPFGTDEGRNVIALATCERAAGDGCYWTGAWIFVDDLMAGVQVVDLLRRGYRLQLYDVTRRVALYQSEEGSLDGSIGVPLGFGSCRLELRAAPREGWRVPLPLLSSSLMVLLAILLWQTLEMRRNETVLSAIDDLAESEARRRDLNARYTQALESLSTLESRLNMVQMYDTVTGLGNRTSLVRRIEASLEAMRQSKEGVLFVLAIGFEHLQHIAHSFGTEFASRVLVIAAERMEFLLPSKDPLFRTGDFNLAAVLPGRDSEQAVELARKLLFEVEAPIALDSHTFMLHPSIGIASAASGYELAETLLDHATAALGAVARAATTRYCLFDSAATQESVSRLQLEADLARAFEENQLLLEYEPFIVPANQSVAGFEALIRWNHPAEGRLLPGSFLGLADRAGLSHRLDLWVLREAVRQTAAWRRRGHDRIFVNVNLSAEAFARPQLAEEVEALLEEFELPGRQLVVELTESTLLQDARAAARTLQRLSELGVGVWLDDFGTGYSSLSHLRTLPLKGVKVDRSFTERIEIDARDFGFLKTLVDLIAYLGMQSIVEGVETDSQFELLSLTACDLYQGHHFSPSMSAAQAESWINEAGRAVTRGVTV
jgi:diguanylate cyclase (GGDEF)-like protein